MTIIFFLDRRIDISTQVIHAHEMIIVHLKIARKQITLTLVNKLPGESIQTIFKGFGRNPEESERQGIHQANCSRSLDQPSHGQRSIS